ncbi:mitochondrial sodium/calcium exchanger protein isoform X3 [Halichoerus grypus]|uniref:mitochondrial sodium/calcium exchanger protein isoform X1 n=1 Tax=Halichoerus grypus TaxID=9711 RepID=UPI0016595DE3|nr:mitochondrial sodium/calcium exchanger protein isoform X1 [Halichoerus grypus]XP_035979599.1 mitochondrial sodium/calcium exchanger protein isoform X1 [Halichoerus grypus]XP_035979600.1 mitochondrial sodium/calcium exchanger protein isoform X1 [Halichoerus grypus]XP_035979601.1 mitochondrial sodium/calcium exchanger protein isoform X1 [Halichoerus grypus]
MVETASGARGPFTGAHIGPQFSALGVNQTPMEDVSIQCRDVCGLNISDRCDFIRTTPDCRSQGGYLNYLEGIFCHFPSNLLPLAITLYAFWLLYLFLILGVTAAKFFCPNLSAISTALKLSHNVAGVTFLAFGNGAPDIFSALVAFSDPRTASLAFGALFGAGVLVTTAVAGGIAILRPFTAASRPFLRDIVFYMVAVFLAFTALYFGRVTLAWALAYLGLYVFYVVTVVLCTWIYRWQRRASLVYSMPGTPEMLSDSEEDPVSSNSYDYSEEYRPLLFYQETTVQILARALNPLDYRKWRSKSVYWRALKVFKLPVEFLMLLTVPVVDPDKEDGNWKRPLNCLHLVISPLVLVLTLQSGAYGVYDIGGLVPVWAVVVIAGTAVAAVTFFATSNSEPPRLHWLFAFLGFLTSALWINAAATEVVNILRSLGVVFRLSNTVLGLTLLAWGNSIGDAFSDFTLARQGYPRMAFSACFGGIILNLLVGVGLGCLLQISRSHAAEVKLEPDGLLVWVLAGALGLSLVCSLVSVPLQCFQLNKVYGFCLLLFYVNFLVVALLTEFGVIHLRSA